MVQHKRTIILWYSCMAPGGSRQSSSNEAVVSAVTDVINIYSMSWDAVIDR